MRGSLRRACAIRVACVTFATTGVAPAAASELAILFEAAGVARHLEAWPEANAGARERARASLSPDAYALLLLEVQATFAAPRLLEEVAAPFDASLAADAIRSLRAGSDSSIS